MTIHIYIIIFSILIVEIIRYFKVLNKFKNTLTIAKKTINVLLSKKISDYWKEKVILKYSQLLFLFSFQILIIFILIITIYLIFNFIDSSFGYHLISIEGIVETSVIVSVYLYFKKPIKGNYSFVQRQLHHLILGNQIVKKSLFKIEEILFAKAEINTIK